jgi:hypothetical protein
MLGGLLLTVNLKGKEKSGRVLTEEYFDTSLETNKFPRKIPVSVRNGYPIRHVKMFSDIYI